ncbi:hypothetical protein [Agriterribacter sp.]|uniref:hypothetical protein n=1 Tax=Agriterribacter sp. TaxID=2821509 RepID=UPI002BA59637|nr:hypothetical protein [Agriterribacter sp.]HRP55317.1 hypothetical protein [Agriterribacter sp.]
MNYVNFLKGGLLFIVISSWVINPASGQSAPGHFQISGIYPHLAYYNEEGECGTGAVVPWAGRLWVITYGPHKPFGSSDKLYEITPDLQQVVRKESIGGTPANRLIHDESNQLFIGPYAIDGECNVRVISNKEAPGRYTGTARHLTDPLNKVYIATMEEGFYEVDVATLKTKTLYEDGNVRKKQSGAQHNQPNDLLPGAHGKGLYSGQGVLVYSNNGEASAEALKHFDIESGVLAEWDGKDWKVIRRNQFVEVTGPGGIHGNKNPATDPIWVTGWDHRSVLVGVRHQGKWSFYRLPKASYSYDGAHGWNTEWPRIRDVGTPGRPDYLMTMHGMFWRFPVSFSSKNPAGIRPRSAYLKVIGDFTRWNDRLVFGCDDAAKSEFLNRRKEKGGIAGPGQSNANLWFTSVNQPDLLGPDHASGSVWLEEPVQAGIPSEPFLFAGWDKRSAWIRNEGKYPVVINFEVDKSGNNQWTSVKHIPLSPYSSAFIPFTGKEKGEWIRATSDRNTKATLSFTYAGKDMRKTRPDTMFTGLATIKSSSSAGALLYSLGNNRRALGILANKSAKDHTTETGYYEMDSLMNITVKDDPESATFIREKMAIPSDVITIEKGAVLITDDLKRRWRLPVGDDKFRELTNTGSLRICREVVTERDLFSCMGTFYELPAENADGFAKIRPVATHHFKINDYASYRGMLILSGVLPERANGNAHIIVSKDKKVAVWAGVIDDLWKLGKPTGKGGPWVNAEVKKNVPSDPFLIGFYDKRTLQLSHTSKQPISITVEVDPTGDGRWIKYKDFVVKPEEKRLHRFPDQFQARWIRFISDSDAVATAWLEYR